MSFLTSIAARVVSVHPRARAAVLRILIYHRVLTERDPLFPTDVTADEFDGQMRLISKHCRPIRLADGVAELRSGRIEPRSVAVTFDDGYADNATVALPILQRYGVPATFFVSSGFLNGGRMWNDSIIESIRIAAGTHLDLQSLGQGVLPLGDPPARGELAEKLVRAAKHLEPDERARWVDTVCAATGARLPDDLMMTDAQVRALADAGMDIGAHTVTHPILRTLRDEQARHEIVAGRDKLRAIAGREIRAFAYPNGQPGSDYTARDRDIVASLGFDFAVSTSRGAATGRSDPFQLPRFTPWHRHPASWLARLLLTGPPASG